jgi:SagB-type dehydrogenase family enzyme
MTPPLLLTFRKDVSVVRDGPDAVLVQAPLGTQRLRGISPSLVEAILTLGGEGATEDGLADLVAASDGAALARLYYELNRWKSWQIVRYTVGEGGRPVVSVEPISYDFRLNTTPPAPKMPVALSKFAFLRRYQNELIVESPLSKARVTVHRPLGAALLALLNEPMPAGEIAEHVDGLGSEAASAALGLLQQAGLLDVAPDGTREEDDPVLAQWAFHDLLFHSRSRVGRHDYPFGGRFRHLGTLPPTPALKPPMSEDTIALCRPDLARLAAEGSTFTSVLESRHSVRVYDAEHPISVDQLGELLYRAARVRLFMQPDPEHDVPYESTDRPYPSGGASYELELYLAVNVCDGLESGLYHYDPKEHRLERLSERTPLVEELLRDAWLSAAQYAIPQVLLSFAARFQRLGWKYDSMAYAATLKNVGVLYQTLYLISTEMGLAPCALGSGNADLLARAIGSDYRIESSVGELMLGSRPPGWRPVPFTKVPPLKQWGAAARGGPIVG